MFVNFGLWLHLLSVCLTGGITRKQNDFLWIWKGLGNAALKRVFFL